MEQLANLTDDELEEAHRKIVDSQIVYESAWMQYKPLPFSRERYYSDQRLMFRMWEEMDKRKRWNPWAEERM